jgi:hypothetical protein
MHVNNQAAVTLRAEEAAKATQEWAGPAPVEDQFKVSEYELNIAFIVQLALGIAFLFTDYIITIILLCFL